MKKLYSFCLTCLCFILPALTSAQAVKDTLYSTLKQKDSILFNEGFNKCNTRVFEQLLSDTFEFYHDEGGATLSKTRFIADFKQNVCGLSYKAKRVVDPGSLKAYPLYRNHKLYG